MAGRVPGDSQGWSHSADKSVFLSGDYVGRSISLLTWVLAEFSSLWVSDWDPCCLQIVTWGPFPASRDHSYPLTHGPLLHLHSQQWWVESLSHFESLLLLLPLELSLTTAGQDSLLLKTHEIRLAPPTLSRIISPAWAQILLTFAKFLLFCQVTEWEISEIREWTFGNWRLSPPWEVNAHIQSSYLTERLHWWALREC